MVWCSWIKLHMNEWDYSIAPSDQFYRDWCSWMRQVSWSQKNQQAKNKAIKPIHGFIIADQKIYRLCACVCVCVYVDWCFECICRKKGSGEATWMMLRMDKPGWKHGTFTCSGAHKSSSCRCRTTERRGRGWTNCSCRNRAASETQGKQTIYLNNGCKAAAPVRERERVAWDRLCLCVHLDVWDCVFVDHGDRLIGAHETESGPCQPSNVSSLCRNQSPIEKRLVVLSQPA